MNEQEDKTDEGMKRCTKCGEWKSLSAFPKRSDAKDGLNSYCKSCTQERNRRYYLRNKKAYKEAANKYRRENLEKCRENDRKYKRKNILKNHEKLLQYFGNRCACCKRSFPFACYDFHHVDPSSKKYNVGNLLHRRWETLFVEAKKCIMVCANCHRIIHAEEQDAKKIYPDY